jgi:hypothetical protein
MYRVQFLTLIWFCDWQEKNKQVSALPRLTPNAPSVKLVILAVGQEPRPVPCVITPQMVALQSALMLRGLETLHVPHAILQLMWQL